MWALKSDQRWHSWLAHRFASLVSAILLMSSFQIPVASAECKRDVTSTLISPDSAWVALVQEQLCSGFGFGSTSLLDIVQIVGRGNTATEQDVVLAIDADRPENRPLTRWLSPQKLQITIPNISLVTFRKDNHEGIEIVIKYEPDDPAERERWLKERERWLKDREVVPK